MSTVSRPSPGGTTSAAPVLVVSRARMVRDAVGTALRSQGFDAVTIGAPTDAVRVGEARRLTTRLAPAVGLYLTELDTPVQLRDAASVVRQLDLIWLVLTPTAPGPAWAAMFEAGASDVRTHDVSLQRLSSDLRSLETSGPQVGPQLERALLAWERLSGRQHDLVRRLETLSPREMTILDALHSGASTRQIAARTGGSPDTVRSQVRSILHKLGARSQLEAVACYEGVARLLTA